MPPPDKFYVGTVIRSHALLHLSSRLRRHFLPRAYETVFIDSLKQLLSCADFFQKFKQLSGLVKVLQIELVPDIMSCMLPFYAFLDFSGDENYQPQGFKMPTGKDVAFIDRRRVIIPSNSYAAWSPEPPCWRSDPEKGNSENRECAHCQRIGGYDCSVKKLALILTACPAADGQLEYSPAELNDFESFAIQLIDPGSWDEGSGGELESASRELLWNRHRLTAGVDGIGVSPEVADFAAFSALLVRLADSLDKVNALIWACSFSGELSRSEAASSCMRLLC